MERTSKQKRSPRAVISEVCWGTALFFCPALVILICHKEKERTPRAVQALLRQYLTFLASLLLWDS